MKVCIDWDEWWPVYDLCENSPTTIDLTEEEIARFKKAQEDFNEMQGLISDKVTEFRIAKGMKKEDARP